MPWIFRDGLRLRREWPELGGAVGMWLWAEPRQLRCGSVSVWEGEEALRRFVALPLHVGIMRRYRSRGRMVSSTWVTERFDAGEVWRRARHLLARHRDLDASGRTGEDRPS